MKHNIICVLITILISSIFATAQFKIKIPKIKKPDMAKSVTDVGDSAGMSRGKNRQMVIDDGFTFFEATPVKVHSPKHRGYIAKGWTLTANLRAFGTFPDDSGFKVVVAKSGSAVATYL
ncbi:MAG: hypothetical protein HKN25_09055, partial [Pyrinomonadaceae bacterium]|nr:hypothetical protein [Pyrinomonadaceae bacterium]